MKIMEYSQIFAKIPPNPLHFGWKVILDKVPTIEDLCRRGGLNERLKVCNVQGK